MSTEISDQELVEWLATSQRGSTLVECPSCKVHPHQQACCASCRDARKLAAFPRIIRALQEERKVFNGAAKDAGAFAEKSSIEQSRLQTEVESLRTQLAEKEAIIERAKQREITTRVNRES